MSVNEDFLGNEAIGKLFVRLAAPAVIAQCITLLYNMVDRIYIGHMGAEGSLALTGIGVCMPICIILSAFAVLVGLGGAPRASIFFGQGNKEMAEKIIGSCALLLILLSIILMVAFRLGSEPLLRLFGASSQTLPYALDYMNIYVLGTPFILTALGLNHFISAQGFTKISMITTLIGAVLNIILDPIFIFALHWGVKGAAFATVISQAVSAAWIFCFLVSKRALLALRGKNLRLDKRLLLPCLALGLSPFTMDSTECLVTICYNKSLLAYGGDIAVGAMTILTTLMQFVVMPLAGIAQGAQPIVSYNYGAKKMTRVSKAVKIAILASFGYACFLWGLFMAFPRQIAGVFTGDQALIQYTVTAMRIYFAALAMIGLQMSCQRIFLALGNAKISLFLALLRKVFLLIPLIYLLPHLFTNQVLGVFWAEPIADTLAASTTLTMFLLWFKKCKQRLSH